MNNDTTHWARTMGAAALWIAAAGCGDDAAAGSGSLAVLMEPEDTITDGIAAGDQGADIRDGWEASFDAYRVVVGHVAVGRDGDEQHAEESFAIDLTAIDASGVELWRLEGLAAGRWDFSYEVRGADAETQAHASVSSADLDAMRDGELSYAIEGTIAKSDGRSCPPSDLAEPASGAVEAGENAAGDTCYENPSVRFVIDAPRPTTFGPCELDGVPGVAVAEDQTQTVAITLHGDHLFFNGFPEGDEGGTARYAQWLADSDLNVDGEVSREELESIAPSDLSELDDRFQLGGSPITPLETMWDYVLAQLMTQGHYQGEGECAIDGVDAHD